MLTICGITYDHTVNYGSCLQAYALQKVITSMNLSDDETCSYMIIPIRAMKDWPVKMTLAKLILFPIISFHRTQFETFEKQHMHYASIRSRDELPSLNQTVDAFICGSDVIWNSDLNFNLDSFPLDFARKYKFSYAASFGKSAIDIHTIEKVKEHLTSFDSISVREAAGLTIIKQIIDKPVKVVCDPVLLMEKTEWEKYIPPQKGNERYIFVYITHLSKTVQEQLERLKKETGYKIIHAAYGPKQAIKLRLFQVQTPERWLQLLHDADYVVTNSFHATAFSVLFHKKFFTVVNGDKAAGINVRMNDFLSSVGLGDRILSSVPEKLDLSEIDYTIVDEKISSMREESLAFLRENLEAAYKQKNIGAAKLLT